MPLRACMEAHTNREYLAWVAWMDEEWNRPTRSDYYLMQLTDEVRHVLSRQSHTVDLSKYKIPFTPKEASNKKPSETHLKQITTFAKRRWAGIVGMVRRPNDGSRN